MRYKTPVREWDSWVRATCEYSPYFRKGSTYYLFQGKYSMYNRMRAEKKCSTFFLSFYVSLLLFFSMHKIQYNLWSVSFPVAFHTHTHFDLYVRLTIMFSLHHLHPFTQSATKFFDIDLEAQLVWKYLYACWYWWLNGNLTHFFRLVGKFSTASVWMPFNRIERKKTTHTHTHKLIRNHIHSSTFREW